MDIFIPFMLLNFPIIDETEYLKVAWGKEYFYTAEQCQRHMEKEVSKLKDYIIENKGKNLWLKKVDYQCDSITVVKPDGSPIE